MGNDDVKYNTLDNTLVLIKIPCKIAHYILMEIYKFINDLE